MDTGCVFSTILQTNAKNATHSLMTSKLIKSLDTEYLWKSLVERYSVTFSVEFNELKINNKYKLHHLLVTFVMQLAGSNMEKYNELVIFIKNYINDTFDKKIICLTGEGYIEKLLLLDFLYGLNPSIAVSIPLRHINKVHSSFLSIYENKKYIMIENKNYDIKNIIGYLKKMTSGESSYYRPIGTFGFEVKTLDFNFKCFVSSPSKYLYELNDPGFIRKTHIIEINFVGEHEYLKNIADSLINYKEEVIQIINCL